MNVVKQELDQSAGGSDGWSRRWRACELLEYAANNRIQATDRQLRGHTIPLPAILISNSCTPHDSFTFLN